MSVLEVRVADTGLEVLLQLAADRRQQDLVQFGLVCLVSRLFQTVTLVQTHAHEHRYAGAEIVVHPGHRTQCVETRQQGLEIAATARLLLADAQEVVDAILETTDVHLVAGEAGGPGEGGQQGHPDRAGIGALLQPGTLHFQRPVGTGQIRLLEYHVAQQAGQEVAASLTHVRRHRLGPEPEGPHQ